jgi:hypothetical protein
LAAGVVAVLDSTLKQVAAGVELYQANPLKLAEEEEAAAVDPKAFVLPHVAAEVVVELIFSFGQTLPMTIIRDRQIN